MFCQNQKIHWIDQTAVSRDLNAVTSAFWADSSWCQVFFFFCLQNSYVQFPALVFAGMIRLGAVSLQHMDHTHWQIPCVGNYYKSQLRYCVARDYLLSTSASELYCITLFKLLHSCRMLGIAFHIFAILQLYGYKSVYPSQAYVCIVLDNRPPGGGLLKHMHVLWLETHLCYISFLHWLHQTRCLRYLRARLSCAEVQE